MSSRIDVYKRQDMIRLDRLDLRHQEGIAPLGVRSEFRIVDILNIGHLERSGLDQHPAGGLIDGGRQKAIGQCENDDRTANPGHKTPTGHDGLDDGGNVYFQQPLFFGRRRLHRPLPFRLFHELSLSFLK